MASMNISLPDELKSFVDEQVARRHGTTSEYVRDLIRRDLERSKLRELLLAGATTEPSTEFDDAWVDGLRTRARRTTGG